jgi:hypothetical protein
MEPFVPPARNQQLDRDQEEDAGQQDDDLVPVGEDEVAERRQEVLQSTHFPLPLVEGWPPTTGQGRWLGAGTLVER